jgi:murein DD-endopeptidase MepM/ murein hydrolase activator NlpD
MHKRSPRKVFVFFKQFGIELKDFASYFSYYLKRKVIGFSSWFEKNKNRLVKVFMMKRGRYNRPFLHLTTMGFLVIGVLVAPFLADTFPIFASKNPQLTLAASASGKQSILAGQDVFQTRESVKPRDKIITYTVENGDTLSTIAKKFDISEDTIRWQNNLSTDDLTVGQQLQILPVTGVAVKVASGDTIYTLAQKYKADSQTIADFPFNEFANPETFSLVEGQMLIIPNGVEPSSSSTSVGPQQVEVAQGPVPVARGGWSFPVQGMVTQYPSWFHMALDIAGPVGTPVYAAHSGTVDRVSVGTWDYGYGTNVWINDGDGIRTHYAHLSCVTVSVGQSVIGGSTQIGCRGNTGHSTGPHTHFEVEVNGTLVNPLGYVSP